LDSGFVAHLDPPIPGRCARDNFIAATAVLLILAIGTQLSAQTLPGSPTSAAPQSSGDIRPTTPTTQDINTWIESLRHDTYAVRQAAAKKLLDAGTAAREQLAAVADDPDPESRAAAKRLVALIDKAEFDHRLAAFAADTDGRNGLTLPGWEQFQKLVGSDSAARSLFVEMQRSEASLLAGVFKAEQKSPGRGGTVVQVAGDAPGIRRENPLNTSWEDRLLRLMRWPGGPENGPTTPQLGSCATMIFLGSVDEGRLSDRAGTYLPQLVQRAPIQSAIQGSVRQDAVRRLVVAWVVECPNRSDTVLQQRLNLAISQEFPEAVPLALSVATSDPAYLTAPPMVRVDAMRLVARMGRPADAEKLEPLLEDASVCLSFAGVPGGGAGLVREIQIRDVALVAMLHLTDQDPAEYGYRHARRQSQQLLDPGSLFTESDDQRTAAIAKWREWKFRQARDSVPQKSAN
jgi:hypothetical protein